MLALSLHSAGIREWSGPWGKCCTPALRFAPRVCVTPVWPAGRHQLPPPHPRSGSYPAFSPPAPGAGGWLAARAAGLHLGCNMERGGCRQRGRRLRRLRVPACSTRQEPLAAAWKRGGALHPGIETLHAPRGGLTASHALRWWHLGVLWVRGISPGDPPVWLEGQTSASP